MSKIKRISWFVALGLVLLLLFYTRFINLDWGFPFPFHPDERNMVNSVMQLNCNYQLPITNYQFWIQCLNPHFFAYGQFPIYLASLLVNILKIDATLALRIISVFSSILTVMVSLNIIKLIKNSFPWLVFSALILIFSPGLIQFAHFGTTESLLTLFFTSLIYVSLKYLSSKTSANYLTEVSGILCGLAIGTKVSSAIFILVPILAILLKLKVKNQNSKIQIKIQKFLLLSCTFALCLLSFYFLSSPHNILSFDEFMHSMQYESAVALGSLRVFYTRQFIDSIPIIFQATNIFPYALGRPAFILFLIGFFVLPYHRKINFLRLSFLLYFLPSAFAFTKWTRFMAPIFPLMLIIAMLVVQQTYEFCLNTISNVKRKTKNEKLLLFAICILLFVIIYPGIRFLKVYQNEDVRFQASRWMYQNIPSGSTILSESGNVVDIPIDRETWNIEHRTYNVISFDFYDLDFNPARQKELSEVVKRADYIVIPSRRVFRSHDKKQFSKVNDYYSRLFTGKLGFKQIAEFKVLDDESAEETWTVFDHPIVRIFKRI